MVAVYYIDDVTKINASLLDNWISELPLPKQHILQRQRNKTQLKLSLLGLQLLKKGVKSLGYDDFQLNTLMFPTGGKPNCSLPLDFNISHSSHLTHNLVVCAISKQSQIGIDTEYMRENINVQLFKKYIDIEQFADGKADKAIFFDMWTQREAVVKAHGTGGIANLKAVKLEAQRAILENKTWYLHRLDIHKKFRTHIASEKEQKSITIHKIQQL